MTDRTGDGAHEPGGRARNTTDQVATRRDGRLFSPSAERNRGPIVDALGPLLVGASGVVLEVGSGTGQHAAALAAAFPDLDWQPSDPFDAHLDSIRAWVEAAALANLHPPIALNATQPWPAPQTWPALRPLAGVLAINIIHIAPWSVAQGIVQGAAAALAADAPLIFYGPFAEGGLHTGEGNARFDALLRAENPAWGVRDLDALSTLVAAAGFNAPQVTPMPSNNRLVCYRRP